VPEKTFQIQLSDEALQAVEYLKTVLKVDSTQAVLSLALGFLTDLSMLAENDPAVQRMLEILEKKFEHMGVPPTGAN